MASHVTRLAPSPTGALHLGNARTFLINWALARQNGWKVVMRMEDIDSPRVKPESAAETIDILSWLGLTWSEDILTQSDHLTVYEDALRTLAAEGLVFSCPLSRRQIEAASSAPHDEEGIQPYPRHLRPPRSASDRWAFADVGTNYRFFVDDESVAIDDCFAPARSFEPARTCGDFVIWTRRGTPAYQLAVVVDDIRQRITDVVRGDDLLESAALQTLLYRALGARPPRWWHLPLVVGPDGRRLAKRHGDTRISTYREHGVPAERIIGLIAHWSGVPGDGAEPAEMSAQQFALSFDLARMPRTPISFTDRDHQWLLSATSR